MHLVTSLLRSPFARRVMAGAALTAALPATADATWSIVMIDTATGEVAIGCATCLENFDLELYCPVMVVGVGGACAQSSIDSNGKNRRLIWDELMKKTPPQVILNLLKARDPSHQSRQYGIVDLKGRRATFTGFLDGSWAGGVVGDLGTIHYAIQGNVLTGKPVVDNAEQAILNTTGDLGQKLMAAMEAAHDLGGDGRCSCSQSAPDSCGSPPTGWDPDTGKSAHVGFMMISRFGDLDGDCNSSVGCTNGTYYLNLNVKDQDHNDPDPVVQLRGLYDGWRADLVGHPDHVESTATLRPISVPGTGTATSTLTLTLADIDGTPIGHGGATVTVSHSADSSGLATIGDPVDHGDGTYTVAITGGAGDGNDYFEVVVDDGLGPVTLYPFPKLNYSDTLKADASHISASAGGTVSFDLIGPIADPPHDYLLLCSASGTAPGFPFQNGIVLPLNYDDVMLFSAYYANMDNFINTDGTLDSAGLASAQFFVEPDDLLPIVGSDLAFAWLTNSPVTFTSNFRLLTVDP